jgi:hypothetical protein
MTPYTSKCFATAVRIDSTSASAESTARPNLRV